MIKIVLVAATRPNFIKVAPLYLCLKNRPWCTVELVYIAQHPPGPMTTGIAKAFGIDSFDHEIIVEGDLSEMARIGAIADKFLAFARSESIDLVVVPGDVDASMASAVAAKRGGIPVAHLEAGLRSFDRRMPEELNRILIDSISDLHLTPSRAAYDNLVYGEGKPVQTIANVGNIMIDSLKMIFREDYAPPLLAENGIDKFILCTFHRPSNVDEKPALERLAHVFDVLSTHHRIVFPVHPRTRKMIDVHGLEKRFFGNDRVFTAPPLDYADFIHLIARSEFIVTDSGGVQEEAAFLKKHCFTFRENTERPQTVECGSNYLIDHSNFEELVGKVMAMDTSEIERIPLWDGLAADRVAQAIQAHFGVR